MSTCIRIEDKINGGGAFLYFPIKSMIGINKINLAYISNGNVTLGCNTNMIPNTSNQFGASSAVRHEYGDAATTTEKSIFIDVSGLTNNQYIFFGGYIGRSGYIDICKIWYT